jgi:hypothetical protein
MTMIAEITVRSDMMVCSCVASTKWLVPITDVVEEMADVVREQLEFVHRRFPKHKVGPLPLELTLYKTSDENLPPIWIKVTADDEELSEIQPAQLFDSVWRVFLGWFQSRRYMFPSDFRYDINDHGKYNIRGQYIRW